MARCISPVKLRNPKYGSSPDEPYFIEVGCNKCYNCLTNRRREWLLRLSYEYDNSPYTYFVTLTYEESNLPVFFDIGFERFGMLDKDHLKDFLHRLKRKYGARWYAIGEYGTHTLRPHYHAILYSDKPIDELYWPYGFTMFEPVVSYAQINYILHYHTRPKVPDLFGVDKDYIKENAPAFSLMSKGLGAGLMTSELIEYLISNNKVTIHYRGEIFVFPRYYQKKFGISSYNSDMETSRKTFNDQYNKKFTDSEYSKMKLAEKRISDKKKRKVNNQIKNV